METVYDKTGIIRTQVHPTQDRNTDAIDRIYVQPDKAGTIELIVKDKVAGTEKVLGTYSLGENYKLYLRIMKSKSAKPSIEPKEINVEPKEINVGVK